MCPGNKSRLRQRKVLLWVFLSSGGNIHRNKLSPGSDSLPSAQSFLPSSWHLQCILAVVHVLLLIFQFVSWESFQPLSVPLCWVLYCAPRSVWRLQNKLHFCFVLFCTSNALHTTERTHCLRHLLWYLTSKQWHMHTHWQEAPSLLLLFFCLFVGLWFCLRLGKKIVFAVHSRFRAERAGDHLQRSTWRSINPIQTAPRRQPSNNLWRLGNLFMFVTVCWKINNVHGGGSSSANRRKN